MDEKDKLITLLIEEQHMTRKLLAETKADVKTIMKTALGILFVGIPTLAVILITSLVFFLTAR